MRAALLFLALLCCLAGCAPFVSPYAPHEQDRQNVLRPPLFHSPHNGPLQWFGLGPDGRRHLYRARSGKFFLLGTDIFGRDLFTRICYGARISLAVGLLGTFLTLLAGTFVGLLAAIAGGWMDSVCMEMTNFVLSLPTLFLLLALRALFPWEVTTVAIYLILVSILALTGWADVARMVRAKVLLMKSEEYVQAALAIGVSPARLIWRHLVPGLIPYWLVQGTLLIPAFLMSEVTLSFLGAGIPEPDASWGNILRQGLSLTVLTASPWILLPGIFIIGTAVSFNALADCLRRLTDTETA